MGLITDWFIDPWGIESVQLCTLISSVLHSIPMYFQLFRYIGPFIKHF